MTRTYPFGYAGRRLTLEELRRQSGWNLLNAEVCRRLLALFDRAQDEGTDLGIGGGWRSSQVQERTFRQRYLIGACPGDVRWQGMCWHLKPGMAPAAPPGLSYHESMPDGFALAADLIGDLSWAHSVCLEVGLRHFANVNNEPWHFQPVEVPTSRRQWNGETLRRWPIPNTEEEIDMIVLDYRPGQPGWIATLWTGDTLGWIVNGHADVVLRTAGVKRVEVDHDEFAGVIQSSRTTTDVPTGMPRDLATLWNKQRGE